jgi:predicted adenylyl cyclase CyaB
MPSNVEIKANAADWDHQIALASELSDTQATIIDQTDTFFHIPNGRLKLRKLTDNRGELIFYQRIDQAGPKQSNYSISITHEPDQLKSVLSSALGILGEVLKSRTVFLIGQTRIHFDEVQKLGKFIELEVVLHENQSIEDGMDIANDLMDKLEIKPDMLIEGAYMDLLLK